MIEKQEIDDLMHEIQIKKIRSLSINSYNSIENTYGKEIGANIKTEASDNPVLTYNDDGTKSVIIRMTVTLKIDGEEFAEISILNEITFDTHDINFNDESKVRKTMSIIKYLSYPYFRATIFQVSNMLGLNIQPIPILSTYKCINKDLEESQKYEN